MEKNLVQERRFMTDGANGGRTGAEKVLEVEEGIWKGRAGKDASEKTLRPCH